MAHRVFWVITFVIAVAVAILTVVRLTGDRHSLVTLPSISGPSTNRSQDPSKTLASTLTASANDLHIPSADVKQISSIVESVVNSYQQDGPETYLQLLSSLNLTPAPEINGPADFTERWPVSVSMLRGADYDLSRIRVVWAYKDGNLLLKPERHVNRAFISRAEAGQSDLDPKIQKADAVDVRIPGIFFSAGDRKSRFQGTLVLGVMRRSSDGAWVPYKSEIIGWPVGIRVAHPPL